MFIYATVSTQQTTWQISKIWSDKRLDFVVAIHKAFNIFAHDS